jgi:hypothetical protein
MPEVVMHASPENRILRSAVAQGLVTQDTFALGGMTWTTGEHYTDTDRTYSHMDPFWTGGATRAATDDPPPGPGTRPVMTT